MIQRTPAYILYRCFDEEGTLLYIGAGKITRIETHRKETWWFHRVTKITLEWFPERRTVLEAEKRAIIAENPLFNKIKGSLLDQLGLSTGETATNTHTTQQDG